MNLSLRGKIALASIAISATLSASIIGLSTSKMTSLTEKEIKTKIVSVAEVTDKLVAKWVDSKISVLNGVDIKGDFKQAGDQAIKSADLKDVFYGESNGHYRGAALNEDEMPEDGFDPRTRPWYKGAMTSGKTIITSPYLDDDTNKMAIAIAKPITGPTGLDAVISVELFVEEFSKEISEITVGDEANIYLVDKSNATFIAHSKGEFLYKPTTEYTKEFTTSKLTDFESDRKIHHVNVGGETKLVYFMPIQSTNWIIAVELDEATEMASLHAIILQNVLLSIVLIFASALFIIWLSKVLLKDLHTVSDALGEIADGDGDLTQRIDIKNHDEIGALAENFNKFVGNMHGIVTRLSSVSTNLNIQAHDMNTQSGERRILIQNQQGEVNMVATAIHEMASATQEIAKNAEGTANASDNAVAKCKDGESQVVRTQESINELANEVQSATEIILKLEDHGNAINAVLATIQDIAEQTNLLALNAAIEAARAGDAGRGFAVVADEVRILSQNTHKSTKEIQETIETLRTTTADAVGIMETSRELASKSVSEAESAAYNLSKINQVVVEISDMASQIATAAEEQASVTDEITKNTEMIRDAADDLSEKAVIAEEQSVALSGLSGNLNKEIGSFKL